MPAAVRKSVRLSGTLLKDIEAVNQEGEQFSTVVQKALRRWVRYQRRKAYGQLIKQAAAERSPEQTEEDQALVETASRSGLAVLQEEESRG